MKSELKVSKSCTYCEKKYLSQEWKYDENKLSEWITYTNKNKRRSKKNYFYDENQNLIKQIDSTGWYYTKGKPFLDSTTEIVYTKDGKFISTVKNSNEIIPFYDKTIEYFDKNNLLVKHEEYYENRVEIHEYFYENSTLKYLTSKYGKDDEIRFEYSYNEKGLLKKIKHYIGDKLVNIEQYYYE